MSERIKRYESWVNDGGRLDGMWVYVNGDYVRYSDHLAALEAARAADKAEIERLETARAELWRKCRDLDGSLITKAAIIAEQSARIAELEAGQDEAARRDAERYRFIRDVPWFGTPLGRVIAQQRNAHWDASIDAAIAAAREAK